MSQQPAFRSSVVLPEAPVDSFPQFTELPTEIRQKIWRFWMSPRLVELRQAPMQHRLNQWDLDCDRRHIQALRPDSAAPLALLGVNRESRSEMLLFYSRSFGLLRNASQTSWDETVEYSDVAFNPYIDTLFLYKSDVEDLVKLCATDLDRLRYAAVFYGRNLSGSTLITSLFPALGRLFMSCQKLERLSLWLIDPYSRVAKVSTIKEQDEARRKSYERSLLNYWDWYTFEGKHNGELSADEVQKRWKEVVRVQFISQLREERGITQDQRPEFEIDW